MYQIVITKSAIRDLDSLSQSDFRLVDRKILSLRNNPRPRTCKKLKGRTEDYYRVRQGNYRIIFSINDGTKIVTILEVSHRREACR